MFGKNHNLTLFYLSYLEKKHKIKGTREFNLHFMTHYSRLTSDKIFPSKAISGNLVSSTMLPQKNEFSRLRVIIQHFLKKTKVKSLSFPSYLMNSLLLSFSGEMT